MKMSNVKECTPEEIEEKRRLALELRNNRKAAEQKKEFHLSKKPRLSMKTDTENNLLTLTSEQTAQIERNRLEAIARATANNLIPAEVAKDLAAKKISPGKVPHNFLKTRNSSNPLALPSKLQFPIKAALQTALPPTSTSLHPQKFSDKSTTIAKAPIIATVPNDPISCQLRFISENRFEAFTDTYNDVVITEFKKIRSKSYSKLLKDKNMVYILTFLCIFRCQNTSVVVCLI